MLLSLNTRNQARVGFQPDEIRLGIGWKFRKIVGNAELNLAN